MVVSKRIVYLKHYSITVCRVHSYFAKPRKSEKSNLEVARGLPYFAVATPPPRAGKRATAANQPPPEKNRQDESRAESPLPMAEQLK